MFYWMDPLFGRKLMVIISNMSFCEENLMLNEFSKCRTFEEIRKSSQRKVVPSQSAVSVSAEALGSSEVATKTSS